MKITIKNLKKIIREVMLNNAPTLPKIRNALSPAESSREQLKFINKIDNEEISAHLRDEEIADNDLDDLTVKKKEFPFVITIDPYTRFY